MKVEKGTQVRAPPGGDTAHGPSCGMDVIEVRGRLYDLIARDDDVGGEGTDGRVVSPAQKAKSGVSRGEFRTYTDGGYPETMGLRRLWTDWITFPSARWDKNDTFIQELISVIICRNDGS